MLRIFGIIIVFFVVAILLADAQGPANQIDDEDAFIGRQTFIENCLICHGEEMTTNQRLTAKQWTAEIDKMIGWGAPVPIDKRVSLLSYLTSTYTDSAAKPKPDSATLKELIGVGGAAGNRPSVDHSRGGPLYIQHCATCHGPNGQGGDLGPNLIEKPILLQDDAYQIAVRNGLRRMPGFAVVLKPDAEAAILGWLRSRHTP